MSPVNTSNDSQPIVQQLLGISKANVRHRVWLISDLQQSDPAVARECLTKATEDFAFLSLDCEQIWYLGDAVQGTDLPLLEQMAAMQIELLQPLGIPLIFTCGNHDFDPCLHRLDSDQPACKEAIKVVPRDLFAQVPGWRTAENISDFYFIDKLGDYALFFFPDHAQAHGSWITSSGKVCGHADAYPHTTEDYRAVRQVIENTPGPVIVAGHNAFAGGLRPSSLMNRLLPLPDNVIAHFHGHSHIGDAHWGGPACFRKLSTVDGQKIPQFDVAALENIRGDAVRSAILEIYQDGSIGVLFREHCRRRWSDAYIIAGRYKDR